MQPELIANIDLVVDRITKEAFSYLSMSYVQLHNLVDEGATGGKIRNASCKVTENLVQFILNRTMKYTPGNIEVLRGVPSDTYLLKNFAGEIRVGTDFHVYKDNIFIMAIECKSYLDKPFMERAHLIMGYLKKINPQIVSLLVSMEYSLSREAFNFYMYEGNINYTYFLMDGIRNSDRPVYKREFFKSIKYDSLRNVVNTIVTALLK